MANQQSKERYNGERQNEMKNAGHICSKYEAGLISVHILCNNHLENEICNTL